jgi:MFS transporter, SP family, arabinose:H+ symporter
MPQALPEAEEQSRVSSAVPPALSGQRCGWYLALVCLVASLGGLLFGFDTAVISGTFGLVTKQFLLTKFQVGWYGSSALAGCIAGAAVAGWLSDRFGRKPVLLVSAVFFFLSALYAAIPPNFQILIWARIIGGVGVGMASVVAPLYMSEFSPPRLRGRLVATYQLSIVIGILAAYFSNWWLARFAQTHPQAFGGHGLLHWTLVAEVWRGMFGAEMIPCLFFFLLLWCVPESPRWLAKRGQEEKAFHLLTRISGDEVAHREMAEMKAGAGEAAASIRELFQPGLRLALIVGLGLSVFGQMTGVNIVVYYGPTILEDAGFKGDVALQFQVGFGLINLLFTLLALWRIDHWGRRPLLIWGMAAVVATLATAAVLFPFKPATSLWIAVALGLYMASVAFSICAVIWVLTPELFPTRVRGRGMSIATFANWGVNAISAFLFPWYVGRFGMAAGFFTFAGICLVATLFFWRFVPETKGRSLEEIERSWQRPKFSKTNKP